MHKRRNEHCPKHAPTVAGADSIGRTALGLATAGLLIAAAALTGQSSRSSATAADTGGTTSAQSRVLMWPTEPVPERVPFGTDAATSSLLSHLAVAAERTTTSHPLKPHVTGPSEPAAPTPSSPAPDGSTPEPTSAASPSTGSASEAKHTHQGKHDATPQKKHKHKPSKPSRSGAPGPSNTGVPAGTRLRVHQGDIDVRKAGTVIDGLDVHGAIKVNAPNVTIKNTIIRFRDGGYRDGIHSYSTGLRIVDTEISPTHTSPNYNGIMGSGFTATRVDIHRVVDAVHIYGNNVVLEDSWLHDNTHFQQDPNQGGKPSHDDSIQIVSGKNIRIAGNNYDGAFNSGIQITQDNGTVSDVTIDGNLAGGGGCSVNVAEKGGGPIAGIAVRNNRFYRDQRVSGCAIISPESTHIAESGNEWAGDGQDVRVKSG